jgi:DNA-binding MarR family transcriptional regulator
MSKLTPSQLQVLLQLRRSQKPLTRLQLGTTGRTLESLLALDYIEVSHNPTAAKITTAGILATTEHIKNNQIVLPDKRSHLQEHEFVDLVSLYYPNHSLFLLLAELRQQGYFPINIGADILYSRDKIIEIFDYLRAK